MIRNVTTEDAEAIAEIYNGYIRDTTVTFETRPLSADAMAERISGISARYPYLVYESDGKVSGYCYVHAWKERAAYEGVVESSVYLSPQCVGKGIGTRLMRRLIEECRQSGCRVIIASVTGENNSSRALHTRLGFRQVGDFKSVGLKFGQLIDVVFYELIL